MPLAPGTRLGPYEILAPLGAGGMGEVYRARDPRLGREVAVKVLPASAARDPGLMDRLEQEARAVGALSHPGILAIHDVGTHEGAPYLVTELLEGETLRQRLRRGPLPPRRAVELAAAVARALGAAHEKGVVHRDLKPENVFLTSDGHVKVLDFGLARREGQTPDERDTGPALAPAGPGAATSDPAALLGTVGYVSPEQIRGQLADARSDIFSFGVTLHEMLSGRSPFGRDTAVETLHAILHDEAAPLSGSDPAFSAHLERVVLKCLEKAPEARFQSARDLAFHLEAVSSGLSSALPPPPRRRRATRRGLLAAAATLALLAALAGAFSLGLTWHREQPRFHQVTFRRGTIHGARLSPDGGTVVYGAGWEGQQVRIFAARPDNPESLVLLDRPANVLAVSPRGELALTLLRGRAFARGTLARMPLSGGGAPRELAEGVEWADWAPDGDRLAVVRALNPGRRLEFPLGTPLAETRGWMSHARVSPSGETVAYVDHPVPGDNRGSLELVGATGRRTLSGGWKSIWGLAWSPRGDEVWFTASDHEAARDLYAVRLDGTRRLVQRAPLRMTLYDIDRDGRLLVSHDLLRRSTFGRAPGEEGERDLTWLDYSNAKGLSSDGRTLLFSEDGEGGGPRYSVYLRGTDGSPAKRLGEGKATSLSPDGRLVAAVRVDLAPQRLTLLPTGAGEALTLAAGTLVRYDWALFLPDGRRLVLAAAAAGEPVRLWLQDLAGGPPRPAGREPISAGHGGLALTPDGSAVAAVGPAETVRLYPLDGGESRPFPGVEAREIPIQWTPDGEALYVFQPGALPSPVTLVERATGRRTPWLELMPPDPAGILGVNRVRMTPDGKAYTYTFSRILSDLFVVEGLR